LVQYLIESRDDSSNSLSDSYTSELNVIYINKLNIRLIPAVNRMVRHVNKILIFLTQ
jgi:hypothetical protein